MDARANSEAHDPQRAHAMAWALLGSSQPRFDQDDVAIEPPAPGPTRVFVVDASGTHHALHVDLRTTGDVEGAASRLVTLVVTTEVDRGRVARRRNINVPFNLPVGFARLLTGGLGLRGAVGAGYWCHGMGRATVLVP